MSNARLVLRIDINLVFFIDTSFGCHLGDVIYVN